MTGQRLIGPQAEQLSFRSYDSQRGINCRDVKEQEVPRDTRSRVSLQCLWTFLELLLQPPGEVCGTFPGNPSGVDCSSAEQPSTGVAAGLNQAVALRLRRRASWVLVGPGG
ncbi:unnamed protein product [Pleuronectes platessa]|uniref:Uncharacterized protein n=1 Tax=Pleuronectes platessa TaxID=8262 RepID=A0A9N7Y5B8_PLEPL|nr:unnamed protein product [Pleuronectes platessa]